MLSEESLVRLLIGVGGVVTGVASTVAGSWISSKIHVYHENREAHLNEIKQKVFVPIGDILESDYSRLVTHQSPAVVEVWSTRRRKENATVTEYQIEDGPALVTAGSDIVGRADPALFFDAKSNHCSTLIISIEQFAEAWREHARECHAWVGRLSDEILAKSEMAPFPAPNFGTANVKHYHLGIFLYRRLFHRVENVQLLNHSNPPNQWILEGFEGTSAMGTEQQLAALVCLLNELIAGERSTADRLQANARVLEQQLSRIRAEINHAIAYRRLRKGCDLVPFF